jgi:hypothetical protein
MKVKVRSDAQVLLSTAPQELEGDVVQVEFNGIGVELRVGDFGLSIMHTPNLCLIHKSGNVFEICDPHLELIR